MKALLALFLALFALTASGPALAGQGNCSMPGHSMQGAAMESDSGSSDKSCCDHANISCAIACDMVCGPSAVMPADRMAEPMAGPAVREEPIVHLSLHSVDFARIDPPPKTIG